jgi:hypothetical protein
MRQRTRGRAANCKFLSNVFAVVVFSIFNLAISAPALAQDKDDEIVASLAGGRVIIHATQESITFIALDEPIEAGSAPPRVMSLDSHHVAVLLGSSEWRMPADPNPIRMDQGYTRTGGPDPRYQSSYSGEAEADLEQMGVAFLEKLTPLAARLHHKLDFPADQPLFELVVIGFGPRDYGPEVWTVEYRMTQTNVATRGDFWQTRVLRPRFVQIYPPEKHAPRKLVETCYPGTCKGPTLQQLLEGNEPGLEKLAKSDSKVTKAVAVITNGQAQKAVRQDADTFLRAAVPLIYPDRHFVMATLEAEHGFQWIVPPNEPMERARSAKTPKTTRIIRRKRLLCVQDRPAAVASGNSLRT